MTRFVNQVLIGLGLKTGFNFLTDTWGARWVIVIALIGAGRGTTWRSTAALQNDRLLRRYEAAKIDGASAAQCFWRITVPPAAPPHHSAHGHHVHERHGLQLFDESVNLTKGGPANMSITMSHYIYKLSFEGVPNFGYASALSFIILILVAVLAFVQMKVGDKRD